MLVLDYIEFLKYSKNYFQTLSFFGGRHPFIYNLFNLSISIAENSKKFVNFVLVIVARTVF